MISISVTTKGNLRLREMARYLKDDRNFGFTSKEIHQIVQQSTQKAFGKPARVGLSNNHNASIPGNMLLRSINKMHPNSSYDKLTDIPNSSLLSVIKSDSSLFSTYSNANRGLDIVTKSSLGVRPYSQALRFDNGFLSLNLHTGYLDTSIQPKILSRFNSYLNNSVKVPSNFSSKEKKTKSFTIAIQDEISSMPISSSEGDKEKFLSGLQLSVLVQQHLRKTSNAYPPTNPPDLSYRTGNNFINTVRVYPNYRENLMSYFYNPLMDANYRHGYRPKAQVERSIRAVLQQFYKRELDPKTRFTVKRA